MELRQLRYFLKAKELLNFTDAANHLHISQSTLSQQIKQLEEELDVPLFNRIGKRIALTEAGELFSSYALHSVKKAQDGYIALKDLNELRSGVIYIGVTYGLRSTLTPAMIAFSRQYPHIKIVVVFGTTEELIEKLNRLEVDFVLSFKYSTGEEHLKYQLLFTSPMTLVTTGNSPLAGKKNITLKEIAGLPLVLPARGYSTTKFVYEAFQKNGLSPEISIEINDIPTLLDLVRTGNWHTILVQTSVGKEKNFATIPIPGKNMTRTAMIISMKEVYEKKAVKAFYDTLKNFSKVL